MKRKSLTSRQRDILDGIESYIERFGYPPTVREIGDACGLRSPRSVSQHLDALEHKGFIRRTRDKSRAMEVTEPARRVLRRHDDRPGSISLPLIGSVQAGAPALAVEDAEDIFSIDERFFGEREAFLLRARGESMIGAHILDGDILVVQPLRKAEKGDIVVALIGDEATVKRFAKRGNVAYLEPANESIEPIRLDPRDGDIRIVGKVIGVIRRIK
ncbi:MAG: transcriptional repressor LexA [Chitinivibrionia bacterium]|nr:transcriptional repressor LexA [Chitinivibrionia bacterium]